MSLWHENKQTLKLAFPIVTGHVGQMLLGLTDTIMIGRLGKVELAACGLINTLLQLIMAVAVGLATAVSIQVAHAHGSQSDKEAADAFRHGIQTAVAVGLLVWGLMVLIAPHLHLLRQPEEVLAILPGYIHWVASSMALMIPIMIMKSFAEAKNHPWPVFAIQMTGVILNIGLNALLIFGKAGFPQMGLTGAGLATFLARAVTALWMYIYLRRSRTLAASRPDRWMQAPRLSAVGDIPRLTSPISAQILMEYGVFAISALLIGTLGSLPLAAHQIAITCTMATYMLPMGLGGAVGIRVGHNMGTGDPDTCRKVIVGAQIMTVIMMGGFGLFYLTQGEWIARAFSPDEDVVMLTVSLLSIVGVFQLFDGIQVVSLGALRALKDVVIPTILSVIGYWLIAFPIAVYLGFRTDRGVAGFWTGLGLSLGISAVAMSIRLAILVRRLLVTTPEPVAGVAVPPER